MNSYVIFAVYTTVFSKELLYLIFDRYFRWSPQPMTKKIKIYIRRKEKDAGLDKQFYDLFSWNSKLSKFYHSLSRVTISQLGEGKTPLQQQWMNKQRTASVLLLLFGNVSYILVNRIEVWRKSHPNIARGERDRTVFRPPKTSSKINLATAYHAMELLLLLF